jgi:hypothetical protein
LSRAAVRWGPGRHQAAEPESENAEAPLAPELILALKKRGLSESQIREILIESHTLPA